MPEKCHDCGELLGAKHIPGCDAEQCPFCLGQAISCGCIEEHFGVEYDQDVTKGQYEEWEKILEKKGKIVFGAEKPRPSMNDLARMNDARLAEISRIVESLEKDN